MPTERALYIRIYSYIVFLCTDIHIYIHICSISICMYISHLYPTHHKHWKNWSIFNPWRISVCVRTMAWTPCCQVLEEIMQLRGPAGTSIWRWRYEGYDDYEEEQWITRSFHPSVKMGRTWLTSQSWMLSWKSASCLNRYPCKRHVAFQGHKRNVAGSSPGCSCFYSKFWMYNVWERLRLFVGDFPTKSSDPWPQISEVCCRLGSCIFQRQRFPHGGWDSSHLGWATMVTISDWECPTCPHYEMLRMRCAQT